MRNRARKNYVIYVLMLLLFGGLFMSLLKRVTGFRTMR